MSRRANVATGTGRRQQARYPEHGSGVGPASVRGTLWPLSSRLVLGALPTAVGCIRLHAKQVVWEWGLAELAGAVELVVSELATGCVFLTGINIS